MCLASLASSASSLLAIVGCSLGVLFATEGAAACRGAGSVGRGWAAVGSEEVGKGSASIGGATFAFWEQLRVRIQTGEPGRLLSEGWKILHETFCSPLCILIT